MLPLARRPWSSCRIDPLLIAIIACVFAACMGGPARAHAPQWTMETGAAPLTLRFTYSDATPMVFAKVRVTTPDGDLFQMGNTDADGRFSFEASGFPAGAIWQVSAIGDEGHEISADVSASKVGGVKELRQSLSGWVLWGLVVSLGLNLVLAARLFRAPGSAHSAAGTPRASVDSS